MLWAQNGLWRASSSTDNPIEVTTVGATSGAAALVERAQRELRDTGRYPPPKQILLFITGRFKFVAWEAFQVLKGHQTSHMLPSNARSKELVADAAGSMVKAAQYHHSSFPAISEDRQLTEIVDGLVLAGRETPKELTDGITGLLPKLAAWGQKMRMKGVDIPVAQKFEYFLQVMDERHLGVERVANATSEEEALEILDSMPPMDVLSEEVKGDMSYLEREARHGRYVFTPHYTAQRVTGVPTENAATTGGGGAGGGGGGGGPGGKKRNLQEEKEKNERYTSNKQRAEQEDSRREWNTNVQARDAMRRVAQKVR